MAIARERSTSRRPAASTRAYHRCRDLLADELGVDPSPETGSLFTSLLG